MAEIPPIVATLTVYGQPNAKELCLALIEICERYQNGDLSGEQAFLIREKA